MRSSGSSKRGSKQTKRSGLAPLRSIRSVLIADLTADAWFDLDARDCAQNRALDVPCLRGYRPDSDRLVARVAVRFAAVVGCLALGDAPLISALAETTGEGAVRSGKMHVMSVA